VQTDLFDYQLPRSAIATHPPVRRDGGRMLVLHSRGIEHRLVQDWPELLEPGSLVVLNDTRVIHARLLGRRAVTGGRVELLLLERVSADLDERAQLWLALGRASKALRPGSQIEVGSLGVEVLEGRDDGTLLVRLSASDSVDAALSAEGHVPIPPYLERPDEPGDVERYQTVYAARPGSVAAPTAGLHLTEQMIERARERGVALAHVTLHVGAGTFRGVSAGDLDEHPMHSERFEVPPSTADAIARARCRSAAVVAVGTTVVRALEAAADPMRPGHVRHVLGRTDLLIQPGHTFEVVDALLTNFHMPRSTLVALVSAFAGRERLLMAYEAALAAGYRFLSYGDAMWLPRRLPDEAL
jgi:S-adenosylmethionine:tRNA ribosyltransferase-isomerase